MKLKTLWMIWIAATIVILVSSVLSIYASLQHGKLNSDVNSWRDIFKSDGYGADDKPNPFKEISGTTNFTSNYSGLISSIISLALICYGHFLLYKAKQNGEAPSVKSFMVLTILALLALVLSIVGLFLSSTSDYMNSDAKNETFKSGDHSGKKAIDVFNDRSNELVPKVFGYIEPAIAGAKFVATAVVWWGCAHFKQTQIKA